MSTSEELDAGVWIDKGIDLSHLGKYREAIACYDKALKRNSRVANPWVHKGVALYELGEYQEVRVCFVRAEEINAGSTKAYIEALSHDCVIKGNGLYNWGEYQAAIA